VRADNVGVAGETCDSNTPLPLPAPPPPGDWAVWWWWWLPPRRPPGSRPAELPPTLSLRRPEANLPPPSDRARDDGDRRSDPFAAPPPTAPNANAGTRGPAPAAPPGACLPYSMWRCAADGPIRPRSSILRGRKGTSGEVDTLAQSTPPKKACSLISSAPPAPRRLEASCDRGRGRGRESAAQGE